MLNSQICFFGRHNSKVNIFVPHRHDFYEVIYFVKGKGRAIIADNEYSVDSHRYCIVPPRTEHVEILEEDGEILFVGFQLSQDILPATVRFQKDAASHGLSLLESILGEFKNQRSGYREAASAYLQLFLIDFMRRNTKESAECRDLHYIKTYIEQYYSQKINFRELAALTGYSPDYFRHIFKQTYGTSPQEYLIKVRLEQAKNMLQNTRLSCTQISASCGFSNSGQMSVMIRREYGKSPLELRKAD